MNKCAIILVTILLGFQRCIASGTSLRDTSAVIKDSVKIISFAGQQKTSGEISTTWYQMFTQIPTDEYSFFQNSFQLSEIPTYLGLTAITGTLMKVDQSGWKVDRRLYNNSNIYRKASDLSVYSGEGGVHFALSGLFASYGLIYDDPIALKTSSNIAESVLATGVLVQVLKRVTGRESPAIAVNSKWRWQFFPSIKEYQKNQPKYYSFPSGHIASATTTLTVIANNYPEITWLKPVGYSVLGLLGMGLVSKGMHWYSDLPFGFFIGYSMGNIIAPRVKLQLANNSDSSQLMLSPDLYNKRIGMRLAYSF
jgi:hypothetical protein